MTRPHRRADRPQGFAAVSRARSGVPRNVVVGAVVGHRLRSYAPAVTARVTLRVRNQPALAARIEAVTREQLRAHWLALFEANEIPCGPINNYEQVFADRTSPGEMAVGSSSRRSATSLGHVKMSDTPTNPRRRAPLLGEHTDEVLKEYGFSADEIASLRGAGAVA